MKHFKKKAFELDQKDPLKKFRNEFHFPKLGNGKEVNYFVGNSLGLESNRVRDAVIEETSTWAKFGVDGHFKGKHPWMPYHEEVTESLAKLCGAKTTEVVAMNSLSVNLHLMMVSFYRPTKKRFKILIEKGAFPSDRYAVRSQIEFHARTLGFDPRHALIEVSPTRDEWIFNTSDFTSAIEAHRNEIALVLIGNTQYLTGQSFDMGRINKVAHQYEIPVGWDLAHGMGNIEVNLHKTGADFAVWCSYKHLNSGPGGISGVFVHERHLKSDLPRFSGWWGHDKKTRFKMPDRFVPIASAEAWQLSNPPIFQLAALRASLSIFDEAELSNIRSKSVKLTDLFIEILNQEISRDRVRLITPAKASERGSQMTLLFSQTEPTSKWTTSKKSARVNESSASKKAFEKLEALGVVCDYREPGLIRVALCPLYTRFVDVCSFFESLKQLT